MVYSRDLAEHDSNPETLSSSHHTDATPHFPRWGRGRRAGHGYLERDCFGWRYIDPKANSNGPSFHRLHLSISLVVTESYDVLVQCKEAISHSSILLSYSILIYARKDLPFRCCRFRHTPRRPEECTETRHNKPFFNLPRSPEITSKWITDK